MKCVYSFILLTVTALVPAASFADPLHLEGNVSVLLNQPGGFDDHAYGQLNVRYSSNTEGQPFIGADGYANSTLYFAARDRQGEELICMLAPGDDLYEAAVNIKNNLTNGSSLSFSKLPGSNKCGYVYSGSYSYRLD